MYVFQVIVTPTFGQPLEVVLFSAVARVDPNNGRITFLSLHIYTPLKNIYNQHVLCTPTFWHRFRSSVPKNWSGKRLRLISARAEPVILVGLSLKNLARHAKRFLGVGSVPNRPKGMRTQKRHRENSGNWRRNRCVVKDQLNRSKFQQ